MLIVRVILAAVIAISVAMLPATGGAVASSKPIEMSMADNANMPCCAPDDCKDSSACALKCFNFVGVVLPAVVVTQLYLIDAVPPSIVDGALREHVSKPPTHPPPV